MGDNPYRENDYPSISREQLLEACSRRKALLHECRGAFRVIRATMSGSGPIAESIDILIESLNDELGR